MGSMAEDMAELLRLHAVQRLTVVSLEVGLAAGIDGDDGMKIDPLQAWRQRVPTTDALTTVFNDIEVVEGRRAVGEGHHLL
jgi:hypothetical protein